MKQLGERIKTAIKKSRFTQKGTAKLLGISENGLSNYITGKRIPDIILIYHFCELCNCSIEWLVSGENIKTNVIAPEDKMVVYPFDISRQEYLLIMQLREMPEVKIIVNNIIEVVKQSR